MTTDSQSNNSLDGHSLADEFVEAGMNEIAARIMDAAMRLFSLKGYSATSVREIVQEADVTNPMLYYYFESKKGVFSELINFLFTSMANTLEEVLSDHDTLEDQLQAVARAHFDACRNTPEVLRFIYSVLFGPVQSRPKFDMMCTVESHHSHVQAAFSAAIERGEFSPRKGFDAHFLTERYMGLISNHLMSLLAAYDYSDAPHGPEFNTLLDEYLGDEALNRMHDFFFSGAGRLTEETP